MIKGMDVVDQIAQVPTARKGPHGNVPVEAVVIQTARRKYESAVARASAGG